MDRFTELQKQIDDLKAEVAGLKSELLLLSSEGTRGVHSLEALLRQQGLPVIHHGDHSQIVFPPNMTPGDLMSFYRLMRRYSFRLFMRDLIRMPHGRDFSGLTRYCSLRTVRGYMSILAELEVVSTGGGGYSLSRQVPSFGPTLEWFVCEIFRREFLAPALFNVHLQNTRFGGDYDVISILAGHPVYVEVKSSPPRGVEHQAVNAFLRRVTDLRPHVAILLVDTELRMADKLAPLLSEGLELEGKRGPKWAVLRLVDEIFHVGHSVYLINSRKGVYSNLRTCFRDFLLWERKEAGASHPN